MGEWSPGERADAHQIVGVLREKFGRAEKIASREFVADYFRCVGATSVLDLWGGGASAEALRRALPDARIVSVENGSVCGADWFADRRGRAVTRQRLQRAHLVSADEGGYEAFWGDASKALRERFDAVWLDFCAQWHPSMARLIELAGKSTDYLAVSIMPERDGLGSLGLEDRLIGLAAILAARADMVPAYVGSYRRNDLNQDMALFILDRRARSGDGYEATIVLPRHISRGLGERGFWSSRRMASRKSLYLIKCAKCGDSFTYRPTEASSGSTRRKFCDAHRLSNGFYQPRNAGKPCATCGNPLSKGRHRYCSERCQPSRALAPKNPCPRCSSPVPLGRRTYCSDECSKARSHRANGPATCHPDRPVKGYGLCQSCYGHSTHITGRAKPSECHPHRRAVGRKMCGPCYNAAIARARRRGMSIGEYLDSRVTLIDALAA